MPLSTIGSVADAVAAVAKFLTPKETENVSQDYEQAAKNRLDQMASIIQAPDSVSRADRLSTFSNQLCLDANRPTGNLSGVVIPVPVEVLQSLYEIAIDDIRATSYLGPIIKALGNK